MENTVLLELNQGQTQTGRPSTTTNANLNRKIINNANGDFEVIISPPIVINEGDNIECQNAFLDTRTLSSGNILIKDDLTISTKHIFYKRNLLTAGMGFVNAGIATDNLLYPLSRFTAGSSTNIAWVSLEVKQSVNWSQYDFWGIKDGSGGAPLTLQFSYINVAGDKAVLSLTFPQFGVAITTERYAFTMNTHAQSPTPVLLNDPNDIINNYGVQNSFIWESEPFTTGSAAPIQVSNTFVLSSGNYTPQQLAKRLTDKFNEMDDGEGTLPNTTKVPIEPLPNATKYLSLYSQYDKVVTGVQTAMFTDPKTSRQILIPVNRTIATVINAPRDLLVGTNQVSITYNEDIDRLQFDYLHFPLYNTDGDLIITFGQLENSTSTAGFTYDVNRCCYGGSFGGIAFTSLQPVEFWRELGFDLGDLLVNVNHPTSPALTLQNGFADTGSATGLTYTVSLPVVDIVPGLNTTSARITLDAAVTKTNAIGAQFQTTFAASSTLLDPNPAANLNSLISATDFIPIVAKNSLALSNLNRGYYVANIDCVFKSNTTGSVESHVIKYIINRYYSVNSFTSSASDGILYTHYGTPTLLSSIKVRITEPDGTLVSDIGINNSIIMRLTQRIVDDIVNPDPKK